MRSYKKEWMEKKGFRKIIAIFIVLSGIAVAVIARSIYLKILLYNEAGNLSPIYIKNLIFKVLFSLAAGMITFFTFTITGLTIKKNSTEYFKKIGVDGGKPHVYIPAIIASVITAVLVKELFYREALLFFNSVPFNVTDPVLGKDIGYYIFTRPFQVTVYNYISTLWTVVTLYTVIYYLISFAVAFSGFSFKYLKIDSILSHNLVNAAVFLLIFTCSFIFKKEDLLYANVVDSIGASFVHVKIWIPYYTIMIFVLPVLTFLAFYFFKKKKIRKAAITIGVYPVLWVAVMLISFAVRGLVVKPNEKDMESTYLMHNINMTRQAYKIDDVASFEYTDLVPLTRKIIEDNLYTVENIRIADRAPALATDIQLQSKTSFYTFTDGDISNYDVNGKKTAVLTAVREINHAQLPDKSYINTKYRYTHGYGLVMNPVNKVNKQGQIEFLVSNLNHDTRVERLKVTRPEVYYGEMTHDYAIVNASGINEIDYDGNRETRYQGQGGIRLTLLNRLFFAIEYGDMNLITSGYAKGATLMPNRQIHQRAQMAVPFLHVDENAYMILDEEGRMKWVLDAYTYSDQYPYSQYVNGMNYIRNSVKIVMDAYDGKVEYYVIDPSDPLIQTYMKIYPGIFRTDPLPAAVAEHMKYPEALFKIQSEILKKYHLTQEQVGEFYSQNNLWAVAKYSADTGGIKDMDPSYMVSKLPGRENVRPELLLIRPYTPAGENRHNMVSWLLARNDSEHYGELTIVHFPSNINVMGPYQVITGINQIDSLTKDITLLNQGGFSVYKGSLIIVPVENSILYVEPVYVKAPGNSAIPEVRKVVAGYQSGDQFIYGIGKNLSSALDNLFDSDREDGQDQEPDGSKIDSRNLDRLLEKYNELKKQLEELGEMIENLYRELGE